MFAAIQKGVPNKECSWALKPNERLDTQEYEKYADKYLSLQSYSILHKNIVFMKHFLIYTEFFK